jgi:hypothetical protein
VAEDPGAKAIGIRVGHLVAGVATGYFVGAFLAASLIALLDSKLVLVKYHTLFGFGLALGWAATIFIGYRTGLAAERRIVSGHPGVARREWIVVAAAALVGAVVSVGLLILLHGLTPLLWE